MRLEFEVVLDKDVDILCDSLNLIIFSFELDGIYFKIYVDVDEFLCIVILKIYLKVFFEGRFIILFLYIFLICLKNV